jgi:hypothetical protein
LVEYSGGLRQLAAAELDVADPLQYLRFAGPVLRVAEHWQGTLKVLGRLVMQVQVGLGLGQVGQRARRAEAIPGVIEGVDRMAELCGR